MNPLNPEPPEATFQPQCLSRRDSASPRPRGPRATAGPVQQIG